MYKATNTNDIIRLSDGASIPARLDNKDYSLFKEWEAKGSVLEAADPTPEPTWQEKRQANIADGGYGTMPEQLEIIGEQGMVVYQAHISAVKTAIPKPV